MLFNKLGLKLKYYIYIFYLLFSKNENFLIKKYNKFKLSDFIKGIIVY